MFVYVCGAIKWVVVTSLHACYLQTQHLQADYPCFPNFQCYDLLKFLSLFL